MNPIRAIALDFDNCIALDEITGEGSEEIKDRAWFDVFSQYDRAALDAVIQQVKREIAGGKGDRADIVRRVLEQFGFSESRIADEIQSYCDIFTATVLEETKKLRISSKLAASLELLSQHVPLYINTAAPRYAVLEILEAMNIEHFFTHVYGRPGTKKENLYHILAAESTKPDELLFIDDQQTGWTLSQAIGCRFIGIHTKRNTLWHDEPQPFPIVHSLSEIPAFIDASSS